ncbi:MAG TPA: RidA family protein [Vicinamibacteria bacterium]|jgi:enamine deaminase RidA (YjgF/YER057c/UK114 family)
MHRALVCSVALVALGAAPLLAQDKKGGVVREHKNPPGLSTPRGYTHVVSASGGRTVYVAGQVSLDAKGELVGKGDLRAQARQVFENLRLALAGAGATFGDVVKWNTYVVNFKAEDLPVLRESRAELLKDVTPPASTLVGVQALANPDFLIEVEAVAVVD